MIQDFDGEVERMERLLKIADRIRIAVRDIESKDLAIAMSMVLDEAIAITGANRQSVVAALRKSDMTADIAKHLWADAIIAEAS